MLCCFLSLQYLNNGSATSSLEEENISTYGPQGIDVHMSESWEPWKATTKGNQNNMFCPFSWEIPKRTLAPGLITLEHLKLKKWLPRLTSQYNPVLTEMPPHTETWPPRPCKRVLRHCGFGFYESMPKNTSFANLSACVAKIEITVNIAVTNFIFSAFLTNAM